MNERKARRYIGAPRLAILALLLLEYQFRVSLCTLPGNGLLIMER